MTATKAVESFQADREVRHEMTRKEAEFDEAEIANERALLRDYVTKGIGLTDQGESGTLTGLGSE